MSQEMMQAVIFSDIGQYEVTERPVPEIKNDDDVKFKILAASICGTDVHILDDPPGVASVKGIILGHECVGEVVETGKNVRGLKKGDHLIFDNNITCGVCPACQAGRPNMCKNMRSMGVTADGIFCEYAVAPERQTVKIPKELPLRKAIFAEPLNCVMGAVKKLHVMPGDTAVVLGAGPIGLYFVSLLKKSGAGQVIVSEVSEFRKEHALRMGAARVVNPLEEDLKDVVYEMTDGLGADIVVDAVGSLILDAMKAVGDGGTILLFGLNDKARAQIAQNDITSRDLTIKGNFIGQNTLRNVANALKYELDDYTGMITHEMPLSKFGEGLEAMRSGKALEVILYPDKFME